MNTQNTNTTFIVENKNRILLFVVLFVLSSFRMFGQSTNTAAITNFTIVKEEVVVPIQTKEASIVSLDSQIDFVGWFMGSRQSQMNDDATVTKSKTTSTLKQIITSGITPNKVLYRTFMKRVLSLDNVIV
jgi:hypothetical protein